ncbi:Helix-turn-helix transcriptional regulator [Tenacibaculum sp. 190130A14a]|uniref:Helix-turn-helix transcriptional regulator n=1 Tax=Tenacibaculum polynesiense TaxID=3137857 RepID=A0ABM9PEH8_9FLAO
MERSKENLFKKIVEKLPKNVLLVEDIADVLEISYDAAYRRLKGKTNLSFEEGMKLAEHYGISLNSLYGFSNLSNHNFFKISKNNYRNSSEGLYDFFKSSSVFLEAFSNKGEKSVFYQAAKDVPVYHIPTDTLYGRFRLYAYLNVYSGFSTNSFTSFKKFVPPVKVIEESKRFKDSFKKFNAVEIWSDTTINSLLYQVYYFYEAKFIEKVQAMQMCDEIKRMIEKVEVNSKKGEWGKNGKGSKFDLYNNQLISLGNEALFKSKSKKTLFIHYTNLSHFRVEEELTSNEADYFFKKQLQFSKKVSGNAEVERKLFFNRMYDKVQKLKDQIEVKSNISFI